MPKKRKQYSPEEKVSILRRHLLDGVPVSDLCDAHRIHPNMFYKWQKVFFEQGTSAFAPKADRDQGFREAGLKGDERAELGRLQRENKQLRIEREILSKAAAWFARETDTVPRKSSR